MLASTYYADALKGVIGISAFKASAGRTKMLLPDPGEEEHVAPERAVLSTSYNKHQIHAVHDSTWKRSCPGNTQKGMLSVLSQVFPLPQALNQAQGHGYSWSSPFQQRALGRCNTTARDRGLSIRLLSNPYISGA